MEDEKVKTYSLVRYIHRRIKNNKNFLATITGPTGSGKSWSGLSMAELLDKNFTIDRVIFRAKDLMKLINSGDLKPGSVIIWDEAGIDLSNRNWQSVTNKMLNALLQTFRHKNFILFFTVPYHDFIDSASRKLFHADFETQKINKVKMEVIIKPKLLQYNSNLAKWYRKYLKVQINGAMIKIKRWAIPKPSYALIKAYEDKRAMFTKDLNKDIDKQLLELEPEEQEVKVEDTEQHKTIMNDMDKIDEKMWSLYLEGKSNRDIASLMGFKSHATVLAKLRVIKEKKSLLEKYKLAINRQMPPNNLTLEVIGSELPDNKTSAPSPQKQGV